MRAFKLLFAAGFALSLAAISPAIAQPGYKLCDGSSGAVSPPVCAPVDATDGLRVNTTATAGAPKAGTQRALSISSSTALTVPTGATIAVVQAQGTDNSSGRCLYWQDDGTAPTGSAGQAMSDMQTMVYKGNLSALRLIQATGATCAPTITYY